MLTIGETMAIHRSGMLRTDEMMAIGSQRPRLTSDPPPDDLAVETSPLLERAATQAAVSTLDRA